MIDGGSAVMSADYAGPARGRAYDQWIEELCRRVFQVDFVPRDPFLNSHVVAAVLPDVTLASCTATPTRIESSKSAGDRDDIVFAFATTSRCRFESAAGPIEMPHQPGWLCERRGTGVELLERGRVDTLHISRAALTARAPFANDLLNRSLDTDPAAAGLLAAYYKGVLGNLHHGLDAHGRGLVATHLIDLVTLCIAPSHLRAEAESRPGVRAARVNAILRVVACKAANADLSAAQVAGSVGISERYVRELLQGTGKTFSEHLLEQRLLLAHKLLIDPYSGSRKIAEIALAAGFNDVSHFNRVFRRQFDDVPTAIRAAAKRARSVKSV
jgi:AraC-like DNA-binding protein